MRRGLRLRLLIVVLLLAISSLAALASTAEAQRSVLASAGIVRPGQDDEAKADIREAMGEQHPELTSVLGRLIDDKKHPLNLVTALLNSSTRPRTIAFLRQMANGKALCGGSLAAFLAAHPGRGPLFEKIPDDANSDGQGRSRKNVFLEDAKKTDPARRVGGNPTEAERKLVDDYAKRLRDQVEPLVFREIQALTKEINDSFGANQASFSVRTKTAEGIIDKVQRIDKGRNDFDDELGDLETKPNPGAQVGDLIDAVGARITVQDTAQLARLLQRVQGRFKTGDAGRIIEIENFYVSPKARSLAYRVIPMAVVVSVGGLRYTFELQLTSRRASVAADLNHNTVYKNLIGATPAEQRKVAVAFDEAAAIEQLESRGETVPATDCKDRSAAPAKPTTTATTKPTGAAGSFVLTGSRVYENPYGKEVTIGDGNAKWDHCCDGGKWKIQYTWKAPSTLVPGKPFSISMSMTIVSVEPRQPLLDQMSALAPDFRQDLITQYIGQPSASKTYSVPFSAGFRTDPNIKEVKIYIAFAHASVEYTYRRVA